MGGFWFRAKAKTGRPGSLGGLVVPRDLEYSPLLPLPRYPRMEWSPMPTTPVPGDDRDARSSIPEVSTQRTPSIASPGSSLKGYAMVLSALTSLVVAQPVLDVFGRSPEYFVAQDLGRAGIVFYALAVALLTPLMMVVIEGALGVLHTLAGRAAHHVFVALLGMALALLLMVKLGSVATPVAIVVSAVTGIVLTWLEWRSLTFQRLLRALWFGPLAVLVVFLFFSPTASLIWGAEAEAATGVTIDRAPDIVLLVFDEFPVISLMTTDGTINEERFPNFARLAREGTWFRNATSVSPWTPESVPSVLTGLMPHDGAPTSTDYPSSLFTLLGTEYEMDVHEEITDLCPPSICTETAYPHSAVPGDSETETTATHRGVLIQVRNALEDAAVVYGHIVLPAGLRVGLPSLDYSWGDYLGQVEESGAEVPQPEVGSPVTEPRPDEPNPTLDPEARTATAQLNHLEALANRIGATASPTLHMAHVVFPHFPWELSPTGHRYVTSSRAYDDLGAIPGLARGDEWGENEFLVLQGLQRHLFQVGAADRFLGELVSRMETVGTWNNTLLIIVADHGASFVAGAPRRGPTPTNLDEVYRVPFFVKVPRQTSGQVSDDNVLLVDVLPTIVDVLGIETDWEFDGRSVFSDTAPPDSKPSVEGAPDGMTASVDGLFEAVSARYRSFGGRQDWTGVIALEPWDNLVGRSVAQLDTIISDRGQVTIDQAGLLSDVDPSSGFLPLLLTGTLSGLDTIPGPSGSVLIAINGVAAGVGGGLDNETAGGDEWRFTALVSEDSVGKGVNTVEVLVPMGDPGEPTFYSVAAAG
jgi:hypothetical protein